MCAKKKEEDNSQGMNQNLQTTNSSDVFGSNGSESIFPQVIGNQNWFNPITQFLNPTRDPDPFLLLPPPPPLYGSFFDRRAFGYDGYASTSAVHHHHHEQLRILSEAIGPAVRTGSGPFGIQTDVIGKMTAEEIMEAKALAASKSHSEAERRRRERINNHFARLRSLLPNNTKTDKASLLAEVIQHMKELKRQTSLIAETNSIPTESDELSVHTSGEEDGKFVIKASLCCEDRSDLLPDLIKTLKSLRLKTLRVEITTIAARVRNVLFVTGEDGCSDDEKCCIGSVKEALKSVMEKSNCPEEASSSGNTKRQRTVNNNG